MPILTSVPSEEQLEFGNSKAIPTAVVTGIPANAFTILNGTDNLVTYSKPNAIVRPIRRQDPSHDGDDLDDYGNGVDSKQQSDVEQQRNISVYIKNNVEPKYERGSFTKELDLKLRRLTRDHKKISSKNVTFVFIYIMYNVFNKDWKWIKFDRTFVLSMDASHFRVKFLLLNLIIL